MAKLKITYRKPAALKPRPSSPRTHSKKQIEQIAASIREFGFTNPVLIDADDGIIAGHGRVKAAKLIGMAEVPTVRLTEMTDAQLRAYGHLEQYTFLTLLVSPDRRVVLG